VDTQVAGVGGDARDVKVEPEARFYVPVTRRVTLALRAGAGLLFPANYGRTLVPNAFDGDSGGVSRAAWVRDIQLLFIRGFFSGGAGSNRGYGPREIGPHGTVPFYNPGQSDDEVDAGCAAGTVTSCDLPLGGLTLWEASVELRYPLFGPLTGAVFSDASDVAPHRARFRFDRPHLSVGLGLRYETPVGPIRLDAGYRVPSLQAPASPDEGTPGTVFGIPGAVSLGIGESF
jgi:outer membrane protein insertion porin family/translocation and assembly module TamA